MSVLAKWMNQLEGPVKSVDGPGYRKVTPYSGRTNLRTPTDEWVLAEERVLGGVIGFWVAEKMVNDS